MTIHAAALASVDPNRRRRSGWRLAGLLAAHLLVGVVYLIAALLADFDAYGFAPEPEALDVAMGVAVAGWFIAGGVALWLAATRRRFAFLSSLGWFVAARATVVAICATVPAEGP
jgi:hypothetical protein